MFAFPVNAASDLFRNNFESQFSFFLNLYRNFANASLQLGELNVQAGRKLIEESAAATTQGLQVRTLADTQSFIAEQSQVTVDRMRGYALNVQNIVQENLLSTGYAYGAPAAQQSAPPNSADNDSVRKETSSHAHPHETDPRPSPLVEALVATAVNDADKLH